VLRERVVGVELDPDLGQPEVRRHEQGMSGILLSRLYVQCTRHHRGRCKSFCFLAFIDSVPL
jgi:hypothetical protein